MPDVVAMLPQPGLPDLNYADPATLPAAAVALTADDPAALAALGPAVWGLYSGGAPVVTADTVMEVDRSKSSGLSTYPIESGGFESYDKQATPYEARVRFVSGGSAAARQALLDSVEGIEGDLGLYDLTTNDRTYLNANVVRVETRRSAQEGGASLLAVDVSVQEVRVGTGAPAGQNTIDPASASPVNGPIVQPIPVTPAQSGPLPFFASGSALPQTLGGGANGLPPVFASGAP